MTDRPTMFPIETNLEGQLKDIQPPSKIELIFKTILAYLFVTVL